jgi:4'-phosphopantetheinyl transferase
MNDMKCDLFLGLAPDVVHIWNIPLAETVSSYVNLDMPELLSVDELSRYGRISHLQARKEFLRSRVALRLILAGYLNGRADSLTFSYGEYGKPELAGNRRYALRFNLSHSGDYCLLAVTTENELGIDIEQCRAGRDYRALASRFFSPAEQQLLENHSNKVLFYRMWVLKEAAVKAHGMRLLTGLDRYECYLTDDQSLCIDDRAEPHSVQDLTIHQWQPDENTVAAAIVKRANSLFITRDLAEAFLAA